MGFDVSAWLSARLLGKGKGQKGVSGYAKPKKGVYEGLDEADMPRYQRRGDTDGDYDTYREDRIMDEDDEV